MSKLHLKKDKIIVKFIISSPPYSAGEIASLDIVIARSLINSGFAKVVDEKSNADIQSNFVPTRSVDWVQVQRITKELSGKEPKNKRQAVQYLGLG